RQLLLDKPQPLPLVGHGYSDRGHTGMLHNSGVEFNLVFGNQDDGNVGVQKSGIVGPALQDHQRIAIVGGHAGNIPGGGDGFGEIDGEGDAFAVGDAQAQV